MHYRNLEFPSWGCSYSALECLNSAISSNCLTLCFQRGICCSLLRLCSCVFYSSPLCGPFTRHGKVNNQLIVNMRRQNSDNAPLIHRSTRDVGLAMLFQASRTMKYDTHRAEINSAVNRSYEDTALLQGPRTPRHAARTSRGAYANKKREPQQFRALQGDAAGPQPEHCKFPQRCASGSFTGSATGAPRPKVTPRST